MAENMIETILIDFKGRGIPASINKSDYDPKIHILWDAQKENALKAPLAAKPEAPAPKTPWKPATTRGTKG